MKAALTDDALAAGALGARCTQGKGTHEEVATVTLAERVLNGRAVGDHGEATWALGTGTAGFEVLGGGKRPWGIRWNISVTAKKVTVETVYVR